MCKQLFEQAVKSNKILVTKGDDQITEFHM